MTFKADVSNDVNLFPLRWEAVGSPPNIKLEYHPLSSVRVQYIRSYTPDLQAVSAIRNLKWRHAVVIKRNHNRYI